MTTLTTTDAQQKTLVVPADVQTAQDVLEKAIIDMQVPLPFFAHLVMHLDAKPMGGEQKKNADGALCTTTPEGKLFFDVDAVKGLSRDEAKGFLCEPVMHLALQHGSRRRNRRKNLWKIAEDVEVESLLRQANISYPQHEAGNKVHKTWHNNTSCSVTVQGKKAKHVVPIHDTRECSVETIYGELLKKIVDDGDEPEDEGSGGGGFDGPSGDAGNDEGEQEPNGGSSSSSSPHQWSQRLADAHAHAKAMGKLPGGVDRFIDDVLQPKVSWQQMLRKYLRPHLTPSDYTYSRPHRKSYALGIFLPSLVKEGASVEIIIDTSGSIGDEEIAEFLGEVIGIGKSYPSVDMHVSFGDTKICSRTNVAGNDVAKIRSLKPAGGGGTDMEHCLEEVKTLNRSALVVVVLTDGYTEYDKCARDFPFDVVWCVTKDGMEDLKKIPYGKKVKMQ
jgi:predicted metal-dependent peptidase